MEREPLRGTGASDLVENGDIDVQVLNGDCDCPNTMKLVPPEHHPKASDLVENGVIDVKVMNGEKSPVAIAKEIGTAVVARCIKIIKKHQPDMVHVFTHAGEVVPEEGDRGTFEKGRGGYFSALSKLARVDHYAQVVVPVITLVQDF